MGIDGEVKPSFSAPWAAPAPLEGVKSRKRVVYNFTDSSELHVGDEIHQIAGVKLTQQSRIAAIGEVGRAVVEVLLQQHGLAVGRAVHHEKLSVAHLGPHLAGGITISAAEHLALIEATLDNQRPQVIVLDEASAEGDANWAQAFAIASASTQIRDFRGAVIISVDSDVLTPAVAELCSERWIGDARWVWQEKNSALRFEILEDALSPLKEADACLDSLLQDVTQLSQIAFSEDSVAKAREKGWKLSLMYEVDGEGARTFCGFMCWLMREKAREMSVVRFAVPIESRGQGYGQRLMQWILLKAARMPASECAWIALSSLDTAMTFYEKYGFMDMTCDDFNDPDHFQTRMELRNRSVVPEDEDSDPESQ